MNESMQDKRYICMQAVIGVQFGGLGFSQTGVPFWITYGIV